MESDLRRTRRQGKGCWALVLLALAGCGTTKVQLPYAATVPVTRATGMVTLGAFTDARKDRTHWVGAVRNGVGTAFYVIETERPPVDVVRDAVVAGLEARGVRPGAGRILSGTLTRLECNDIGARDAATEIELTVIADGREVFRRTYSANVQTGSYFSFEGQPSVERLRVMLAKTLSETVDRALDDAGLRAALQLVT